MLQLDDAQWSAAAIVERLRAEGHPSAEGITRHSVAGTVRRQRKNARDTPHPKGHLPARTVGMVHGIISKALADALRWNRVYRHVAKAATIPKQSQLNQLSRDTWTPDPRPVQLSPQNQNTRLLANLTFNYGSVKICIHTVTYRKDRVTMKLEIEETIEVIANEVKGLGVLSMPMSRLRDAYGAGRLGVHVRTSISDKLDGSGIGHFPRDLPDSQDAWVRLLHKGTPAAALINAVLEPSPENDGLILADVNNDADAMIKRVRDLVCE